VSHEGLVLLQVLRLLREEPPIYARDELAGWLNEEIRRLSIERRDPCRAALAEIVTPYLEHVAKQTEERGEQRVPCFLQIEWIERAVRALKESSR
jgi:hypothetical protein